MSQTFAELGLSSELLAAIEAAGYTTPTEIQARAIPALLQGRSVIGQSRTGSGKTAAFGLPLVEMCEPNGPLQALVLAPTRELASQVNDQLHSWAPRLSTLAIYGGTPIGPQIHRLRAGVQIAAATPGRLVDHLERGTVNLSEVKFCVLDEADEMLDFGFEEELEAILTRLPPSARMCLFSATFPPRIRALAERHLAGAERIEVGDRQRTVSTVRQAYCVVRPGKKGAALGRLLDHQEHGPTLVFCRTRLDTQSLADELRRRGYGAEALHGDMDQKERERVMDRFRRDQVQILCATDIAARGLDVEGVTHVFNFDVPWDVEQYIHRVGRTARAGRSGTAITLIEPNQMRMLQRIEREAGVRFDVLSIPTQVQVAESRRARFGDQIRTKMGDPRCADQAHLVEALFRDAEPAAVAAAALQLLWENTYSMQQEVEEEDLAPMVMARPSRGAVARPPSGPREYAWISLSAGRREEVNPADVLRCVQAETGLTKAFLGKILIQDKRTFVEIPADKAATILGQMKRTKLRGKRIKAELGGPRADNA